MDRDSIPARRLAGGREKETTNAVMQCGKLIGYAVTDEDGKPLLVDENGVPVREDHAHRKPVPPFFDEDGNPRWALP